MDCMADGRVEVDFSAQYLADKIMISGVNECKCSLNLKRELKKKYKKNLAELN